MMNEQTHTQINETTHSSAGSLTDAARTGMQAAADTVAELPPATEVAGRSVYLAGYMVSYGMVRAALAVTCLIPSHSAAALGCKDGSGAAQKRYSTRQMRRARRKATRDALAADQPLVDDLVHTDAELAMTS